MKVLLSIIIFSLFFTKNSFSNNLNGKGLVCKRTNFDMAIIFNNNRATSYFLNKDYSSDKIILVETKPARYSLDSEFININSLKINRKNLTLTLGIKKGKGSKLKCETYSDVETMKVFKKLQKINQQRYNKTLEGNKI